MKLGGVCLAAALAAAAGPARADSLDDTSKKLVSFEAEAKELGSGVKKPTSQPKRADTMARRLIDAQVSFGIGNYDGAALLLYDYVAQVPRGRDYDTALYYLGESLFQKGDRVASRTFFAQLVQEVGRASKYYQQSLERLIELSLLIGEDEGVTQWLADLDAVPADKRQPSVPYVRGKYAFSQGQFDEALGWFEQVPQASEYGFQSTFYIGSAHIAKKDLGKATQAFDSLLKREAKTTDEKRIQELSQLALGRLYYERDQPTKAIDSYLLLDRKSDLFPDALYEVAWVYVKAKQFDKALRALELLALADPTSQKLPTVRILEGNLRVRKAQAIHEKIVNGIQTGAENGPEEYRKANDIFTATHATYAPPHDELTKIIVANNDPQVFLAQITGRSSATFQTTSTMPEIAAAWIRDEPDVGRVVTIETDLGSINNEIGEAEQTILRLDAALAAPNRVNVFPSLATKRNRSTEIFENLLAMRVQLADEERTLAAKSSSGAQMAQMEQTTQTRKALAKRLAELPDAGVAYGKRVELARGEFDELERAASELQVAIDSTQATVVAIDKFLKDSAAPNDPAQKQVWETQRLESVKVITELNLDVDAMHVELESIRREIILGRDAAGSGDEVTTMAKQLRGELRAALAAEHVAMASAAGRGDPTRAGRIGGLIRRSDVVLGQLDGVNTTIDEIVEEALSEVRASVTHEKAELAAYRREFLLYEAESRELGGTVLGAAFRDVKAKFYEVMVRSDVGVVDVNWSQKEESDDDLQRLNLDKQREVKQLRDEFSDLIQEARELANPTTPPPTAPPAPAGDPAAPAAPGQAAPAAPGALP